MPSNGRDLESPDLEMRDARDAGAVIVELYALTRGTGGES
jgi:hypothetical protein